MFARIREFRERYLEGALAVFSAALFADLFLSVNFLAQPSILNSAFPIQPKWSLFYWLTSEKIFLNVLILCSLVLASCWFFKKRGIFHAVFAALFIMLFHYLPLIYNPGLPFLVWLHCAFAFKHFIPEQRTHVLLKRVAFLVFCLGYFLSGLDKIRSSPSWLSGQALDGIFSGIYGRLQMVATYWPQLPSALRRLVTWMVPAVELAAVVPVLMPRSYKFIWWLLLGLQIANIFTLRLFVVSVPMILFQLFIVPESEPQLQAQESPLKTEMHTC